MKRPAESASAASPHILKIASEAWEEGSTAFERAGCGGGFRTTLPLAENDPPFGMPSPPFSLDRTSDLAAMS